MKLLRFPYHEEKNKVIRSGDNSIIRRVGRQTKLHFQNDFGNKHKSLLMFSSIASDTELSIIWRWVLYKTKTSVDLVNTWLHPEQMECLVC